MRPARTQRIHHFCSPQPAQPEMAGNTFDIGMIEISLFDVLDADRDDRDQAAQGDTGDEGNDAAEYPGTLPHTIGTVSLLRHKISLLEKILYG